MRSHRIRDSDARSWLPPTPEPCNRRHRIPLEIQLRQILDLFAKRLGAAIRDRIQTLMARHGGRTHLRIRPIANIEEANVIVLAVGPPERGFIVKSEPMCAHAPGFAAASST